MKTYPKKSAPKKPAAFFVHNNYSTAEEFHDFFQSLSNNDNFTRWTLEKCYSFYKNFGRGFLLTLWGQANILYSHQLSSSQKYQSSKQAGEEMLSLFCDQETIVRFFEDPALGQQLWMQVEGAVKNYDPEHEHIVVGIDFFATFDNRDIEIFTPWWGLKSQVPLAEYIKKTSNISQYNINKEVAKMKSSGIRLVELDMRLALYRDNLKKWLKALDNAKIPVMINSSDEYPVPKSLRDETNIMPIVFR